MNFFKYKVPKLGRFIERQDRAVFVGGWKGVMGHYLISEKIKVEKALNRLLNHVSYI